MSSNACADTISSFRASLAVAMSLGILAPAEGLRRDIDVANKVSLNFTHVY